MNSKENRKGALVTLVAVCLSLLFPVIQFAVIDIGRLHILREQLKFDLLAAASGAVTCVDWTAEYTGTFVLNLDHSGVSAGINGSAPNAVYHVLRGNIDPSFTDHTQGFGYIGSAGGIRMYGGTIDGVEYYAEIYNDYGNAELGGSRIPATVISNPASRSAATVTASRPTVFIAAKRTYSPTLLASLSPFGGDVEIVQYSSAALRSTDYAIN